MIESDKKAWRVDRTLKALMMNKVKRLSVRLTAMEHQQLVVVAEKKYRGASLNQAVKLLVEDAFFELVDKVVVVSGNETAPPVRLEKSDVHKS